MFPALTPRLSVDFTGPENGSVDIEMSTSSSLRQPSNAEMRVQSDFHINGEPKSQSFPSNRPVDRPTPAQMNRHIVHRKGSKKYFSVTTPPPPFLKWAPSLTHPNMETRPCHCSTSRIHTLRCGHTVAMPRDAEQCAANCMGVSSPSETELGKKIQDNTVEGFNYYAAMVEDLGDLGATAQSDMFLEVYAKMLFTHQRHRPDLIGGDFQCHLCNTGGTRASIPAYMLPEYFCIAVAKDERDLAVIRELEKGVKPHRYEAAKRGGYGRGRRRGRGDNAMVLDGRIAKARAEEKRTVTARLRDEVLREKMEFLEL